MIDEIKMYARYTGGLASFLKWPLTPEDCRREIMRRLPRRAASFLDILERGIESNPCSPYRRLMRHAGIETPDVAKWVVADGLEGALSRLYDAGVYITLNEFKGRVPVRRAGLEFEVRPGDFDNPLLVRHYEGRTSGSRGGVGSRIVIDFDLISHEAACFQVVLEGFGLTANPVGTWLAVPPIAVGTKIMLRYAKIGKRVERWFGQNPLSVVPGELRFLAFTLYNACAGRLCGVPLVMPHYVARDQAQVIARWLADKQRTGLPVVFSTNGTAAVRICAAALERRLDISGTFFCVLGEPYTQGKAAMLARAGCRAAAQYSMAEIGHVGLPCANPTELDEVHVLTSKVAVIQRPKAIGIGGLTVDSLIYTTILPSCPKLMVNVESDDYGVLRQRDCGCRFGELGCRTHLWGIRSYEKLTSEGVTFLGTELLRLLEEVLPARFGGHPTDYQLVEQEELGLPSVSLLISPRLGAFNEAAVLGEVYRSLSGVPGGAIMADQWRQSGTLRVISREPYATRSAKILPLHVVPKPATRPD